QANLEDDFRELFPEPPPLPQLTQGIERARLADLLSFSHEQIRKVLAAATEQADESMNVERLNWQQLLILEKHLATYIRDVADPEHS
ncbi:MAG: hypothetical protein AB8G99_11280, partial [Planctomycetaceae bacterium]